LEQATFNDNQALNLASSHTVAWGPTGAATVNVGISGTSLTVNSTPVALTASPAFTNQISLTGTGNMNSFYSSPAGNTEYFELQIAGSTRWAFGKNADAETGSNAGSNWGLYRYSDTGT
jgi:hypothetical protein